VKRQFGKYIKIYGSPKNFQKMHMHLMDLQQIMWHVIF